MTWGISFRIPVTQKNSLWGLPEPSNGNTLTCQSGDIFEVSYHFEYLPQSWREWQRIASIKVQIKKHVKSAEFIECDSNGGKLYTVSELGKYFTEFVRFPQPMFPQLEREEYRMLCRHATRLHYEDKLVFEQLVAISFWFNDVAKEKEGYRQVIKRAKSAYLFAIEHKDEWKQKLSKPELKASHSKGGKYRSSVKRGVSILHNHIANFMFDNGQSISDVCEVLDIKKSTAYKYKGKNSI